MKKILATLICLSLLLTVVACVQNPSQSQPSQTEQTTEISQTTQQPQPSQEVRGVYDDIIEKYTELLTAKHKGEELTPPNTAAMNQESAAIAQALYGIVNSCKNAEAVEGLGYGYKDLDGNGIDELILLTNIYVKAIFTVSDEKPILLEANYDPKNTFMFATKNRFFMVNSTVTDNIEEATFYTFRVDEGKIVYDAVYGKVYDQENRETLEIFRIVDGNRTIIDEETFDGLYWEYNQATLPGGYIETAKLSAPRIHYPLQSDTTNEELPIADFSSYASIRETYKLISTCIDEFNNNNWLYGKYDNLFAFPNDLAFEYYTRLLHTAYYGDRTLGYDEIDLNGDGQDELVLMSEDYSIKAIFTKKNGVPVMLEALAHEDCWLDGEGFIHIDREDYYEVEYSVYEFTKTGDYNLVYSIALQSQNGYYLTKDGKTEEITYEQAAELYDDYRCYSEPFDHNEYTRSVIDLTYTPLFESAEDLVESAKDKTWHKYARLDETYESTFATSNTYATFENVTNTQLDVKFTYQLTLSYPDPDNEYTLLDETTESTLMITAHKENGVYRFDDSGVKGRIEFIKGYLWIIFEESNDQRFYKGYHCYDEDSSEIIE